VSESKKVDEIGLNEIDELYYVANPELAGDIVTIFASLVFNDHPWTRGPKAGVSQYYLPQNVLPLVGFTNDKMYGTNLEKFMLMRLVAGPCFQLQDGWDTTLSSASKASFEKTMKWWRSFPKWAQDATADIMMAFKEGIYGVVEETLITDEEILVNT